MACLLTSLFRVLTVRGFDIKMTNWIVPNVRIGIGLLISLFQHEKSSPKASHDPPEIFFWKEVIFFSVSPHWVKKNSRCDTIVTPGTRRLWGWSNRDVVVNDVRPLLEIPALAIRNIDSTDCLRYIIRSSRPQERVGIKRVITYDSAPASLCTSL